MLWSTLVVCEMMMMVMVMVIRRRTRSGRRKGWRGRSRREKNRLLIVSIHAGRWMPKVSE